MLEPGAKAHTLDGTGRAATLFFKKLLERNRPVGV